VKALLSSSAFTALDAQLVYVVFNCSRAHGARMQNIQSVAGCSASAIFPSSSSSSAAVGQSRRVVFGNTPQPQLLNPTVSRGMVPSAMSQQRPNALVHIVILQLVSPYLMAEQ